jgi:predicted nucleic acid-binding protein
MTTVVVCDASVLAAVLLDEGPDGRWAADAIDGADLAAPGLLPFEVANVIRRQELRGTIGADMAAQAHADLLDLAFDAWPYEAVAGRAWELRRNLSSYDAAYVGVAEAIGAPLVTLDRRIAQAPGLRCDVLAP